MEINCGKFSSCTTRNFGRNKLRDSVTFKVTVLWPLKFHPLVRFEPANLGSSGMHDNHYTIEETAYNDGGDDDDDNNNNNNWYGC
jgi:hypothetical protein